MWNSPPERKGPFEGRDYEGLYRLIVRVLITAVAIIAVLGVAWILLDLLVLVFGAAVIAVLIRGLADRIARHTPVTGSWSLASALLVITALVASAALLFGYRVQTEFVSLLRSMPSAWAGLQARLLDLPLGEHLVEAVRGASPATTRYLSDAGILASLGGAVVNLLLVLFGAIFIAGDPHLYEKGLLKLVPERRRAVVGEALSDSGRALKLWFLGQFVSMVIVGTLTWLGLWLIGVPSAAALGLLAGVLEIIPYAGPILAAIPGLLVALLAGPNTALAALALYIGIQQAEAVLVMPLVQKRTVLLPPALTVFGIVAAGILFGTVGLIFAAPLLVVAFVLIKKLYVKEALGTDTPIPGEIEPVPVKSETD